MTNCKFPRVGSFPPTVIKKWEEGPQPPLRTPFPFVYAWASFNFELWEDTLWARCSQGSRELAPWRRLQGDSTPLLKKILYLVGTWYIMIRNFITHFRLKLLSRPHRPTHTKNMVRHIKTVFENQKNNKKTYDPPFSLSKKTWPTPYSTAPPSKNNERSLTTQWLACTPRGYATFCVQMTNLLIYSQVHKRTTGLSDYVIQ